MGKRGPKRKWGPRTLVAVRLPDELLMRLQVEVDATPGATLTGAVVQALERSLQRWQSQKERLKPDTVAVEWGPGFPFRAIPPWKRRKRKSRRRSK